MGRKHEISTGGARFGHGAQEEGRRWEIWTEACDFGKRREIRARGVRF